MTEQAHSNERPQIASAVITHEGKVLLVRRRIKEGTLSWQFPGGEVEPGESAEQAAVREVLEETDLTVASSRILGERTHPNTGRRMAYVACKVLKGEAAVVDTDELDDLTWVSHGDLVTYVPYGFYGPVQEHLDATLSR